MHLFLNIYQVCVASNLSDKLLEISCNPIDKNKLAIQCSEINRKDEEKSARISCPICFDEISEKRKWTAFHPCGHRTCANCFIGITVDNQGDKPCPICRTVISVCVTLEGIY